jgi:hypothetical protein
MNMINFGQTTSDFPPAFSHHLEMDGGCALDSMKKEPDSDES